MMRIPTKTRLSNPEKSFRFGEDRIDKISGKDSKDNITSVLYVIEIVNILAIQWNLLCFLLKC